MFKVLVFAMLSSASGWGLPNDSLLESNELEVDGARGWRQLMADCATGGGTSCDWGCDAGCDNGFWGSCDGSCDRGCDHGCTYNVAAAGSQDQIATTSGMCRCPAPVLSPQPLRNTTAEPACPQRTTKIPTTSPSQS